MNIKIINPLAGDQYYSKIADLFFCCYEKELDYQTWEWAYKKNPIGDAIIVIAEDSNKIVGHYAMIPIPFGGKNFQKIGYLSMTTMVDPDYIKFGIFYELATIAYSKAQSESFVYGFPNRFSMPGFKRRLSWEITSDFKIITIGISEILSRNNLAELTVKNSLNLENSQFLNWRVSKPGFEYQIHEGLIFKKFEDTLDILSIQHFRQLEMFNEKQQINLLTNNLELISNAFTSVPYFFGYRNFGSRLRVESIVPNLLMSDVF